VVGRTTCNDTGLSVCESSTRFIYYNSFRRLARSRHQLVGTMWSTCIRRLGPPSAPTWLLKSTQNQKYNNNTNNSFLVHRNKNAQSSVDMPFRHRDSVISSGVCTSPEQTIASGRNDVSASVNQRPPQLTFKMICVQSEFIIKAKQ